MSVKLINRQMLENILKVNPPLGDSGYQLHMENRENSGLLHNKLSYLRNFENLKKEVSTEV